MWFMFHLYFEEVEWIESIFSFMFLRLSASNDLEFFFFPPRYTKLGYAGNTEPQFIIPSCELILFQIVIHTAVTEHFQD